MRIQRTEMIWLVDAGGLEHKFIGNVIIPTDELIFFRGVGIPPTSYSDSLGKSERWQ